MKAATVVAVALAAFSSFPSPSQKDSRSQQPSSLTLQAQEISPQARAMLQEPAPSQSQTAPVQPQQPSEQQPSQQQPQSESQSDQQPQPGQPNVRTVQLQLITGELQDKLDSKSAKQGDSVVLKTREDVKTPDGTAIPKGSKLVGHVTNVQARGDGKENSQITLQFDRAEVKGGPSLPIESVLESVAPSAGDSTTESNNGVSPMQQPAPGGAAGTPGMASGNGSMNSGTANPPNPTSSPSTATNQSTGNDQPGFAAGPTAQTPAQNAANGEPAPGSIVARNGNVAIRTTSIPGVLIANNITGQPFSNASGMLLGARRDIKLDNGTQMVVGVTAAPQGPGSGMVR